MVQVSSAGPANGSGTTGLFAHGTHIFAVVITCFILKNKKLHDEKRVPHHSKKSKAFYYGTYRGPVQEETIDIGPRRNIIYCTVSFISNRKFLKPKMETSTGNSIRMVT